MPDSKPPSTLSEISHLFLSAMRDKQNGPRRTPPTARNAPAEPAEQPRVSVDLTPEEFAGVCAGTGSPAVSAPISAVLASHLEDSKCSVQAYAQHLSAHNQRIGLIEIGANELRLSCLGTGAEGDNQETASFFEPRHLAEAMEELNADIDRWLVVVQNPKLAESHGAVSADFALGAHYRLRIGTNRRGVSLAQGPQPIGPAEINGRGFAGCCRWRAEQSAHFKKISGVCEQFLHWPTERGASLRTSRTSRFAHDHALAGAAR